VKRQFAFRLDEPPEQAHEHLLGDWAMDLVPLGLGPTQHGEGGCNFHGEYRSVWVYVCCVIFFPIGLLALLASKRPELVSVEMDPADSGTHVEVNGVARKKVWRAIGRWPASAPAEPAPR
jgi:hypothetical protein